MHIFLKYLNYVLMWLKNTFQSGLNYMDYPKR